jgi:hypothetical protein
MSETQSQPTFMELYRVGSVTADDIDDFIDRWHDQPRGGDGRAVSISEFLGMTRDEYKAWVHDASVPRRWREL